jgi:hypothetical protein
MNRSILVAFQKTYEQGEKVKFFNTFHGIPVNFQGKILQVSGARVLFQISAFQINCMLENRGTHLRSPLMAETLRAKVANYNFPFETAELWNFEVTDALVGYRSEIRVEPAELTPCIIFIAENVHLRPTIIDISLRGLSLRFGGEQTLEKYMQVGMKTNLYLALPQMNSEKGQNFISFEAEIRYLVQEAFGKSCRLGLRTQPDKDAEKLLTHFIAFRQKELLAELKATIEEEL